MPHISLLLAEPPGRRLAEDYHPIPTVIVQSCRSSCGDDDDSNSSDGSSVSSIAIETPIKAAPRQTPPTETVPSEPPIEVVAPMQAAPIQVAPIQAPPVQAEPIPVAPSIEAARIQTPLPDVLLTLNVRKKQARDIESDGHVGEQNRVTEASAKKRIVANRTVLESCTNGTLLFVRKASLAVPVKDDQADSSAMTSRD